MNLFRRCPLSSNKSTPEFQVEEPTVAEFLLKPRAPPSRLVLVAWPSLPSVQRGENVVYREGNLAALEMVDDIAAPHRNIGNVEVEGAAGLEHPVDVLEGISDLAVGQMFDNPELSTSSSDPSKSRSPRAIPRCRRLRKHSRHCGCSQAWDDARSRSPACAASGSIGASRSVPQFASLTTSACPLLL